MESIEGIHIKSNDQFDDIDQLLIEQGGKNMDYTLDRNLIKFSDESIFKSKQSLNQLHN